MNSFLYNFDKKNTFLYLIYNKRLLNSPIFLQKVKKRFIKKKLNYNYISCASIYIYLILFYYNLKIEIVVHFVK